MSFVATGTPNATFVALQPEFADTVTSAGQVIVGLVVSRTITFCSQVARFPLVSTTVHTTRFVPGPKLVGALFVTRRRPQLSFVATGTPNATFVALQPEFADTVTSAGQVIVGSWLSVTVTWNVQTLVLPLMSVATLVTMVVPTGKAEPLAGVLTTPLVPQLSETSTLNVTLLEHEPATADTEMSAGQVITGG